MTWKSQKVNYYFGNNIMDDKTTITISKKNSYKLMKIKKLGYNFDNLNDVVGFLISF